MYVYMYIYMRIYVYNIDDLYTYAYTWFMLSTYKHIWIYIYTPAGKHMKSYHSRTFEPLNLSVAPLRIERMVKAGWSWTDGCDVTMAGG